MSKDYLPTEQRFDHDCDECRFLGQFEGYDLWVHPTAPQTVIARYGIDGEYASGLEFTNKHPALGEALKRAKAERLL